MNHHFEHQARSTGMHRRKIHLNRRDILSDLAGDDSTTAAASSTAKTTATTSSSSSSTEATSTSSSSSAAATTASSSSSSSKAATSASSSQSSSSSSSSSSQSSSASSTDASSTGSSTSSSSKSASSNASSTLASSTAAATSAVVSGTHTSIVTASATLGSSSASAASATSSASSSSGSHTTAIVAGAFGAIGGIIVLAIIVSFIVRRLRDRHNEETHFDAAQFRRSAALLDDEFGNDNDTFSSARPPSFLRHNNNMVQSPAMPPATYGNYPGADAYGEPYGPTDPYNQQYGAYPSYAQNMGPAYGANPGETYPASNPIAPTYSASSVPEMDQVTANNTYLNRQPTYSGAGSTLSDVTKQYIDMNRVPGPSAASLAPPADAEDHRVESPLPNPFGAADVHVDAPAVPESAVLPAAAHGTAPVSHAQTPQRPDTVYDTVDAYGGM